MNTEPSDVARRVEANARRWITARQQLRSMQFKNWVEAARELFECTVAEDQFWTTALRSVGIDIETQKPIPGVVPPVDLTEDDRLRIGIFAIIWRATLQMMVQARVDAARSAEDRDRAVCAAYLFVWENFDYLAGQVLDRVDDDGIRERAAIVLAGAVRSRISLTRAGRLRRALSIDQRPAHEVLAERLPGTVFEAWKARDPGDLLGAVRTTVARDLAREGQATKKTGQSADAVSTYLVEVEREIPLRPDAWGNIVDPLQDVFAREEAEGFDERAVLEEALERLPKRQQQVFRLHELEKLTHQQIADKLRITEGGSKSHLSKARQSLLRVVRAQGYLSDAG